MVWLDIGWGQLSQARDDGFPVIPVLLPQADPVLGFLGQNTWVDLREQPDDPAGNAAGPLEGRGTLSFRKPGAASYDSSATLAQYRGSFTAGRADGQGEFLDQSGVSYDGNWRAGLMDGEGRLVTASGDEYVGGFAK